MFRPAALMRVVAAVAALGVAAPAAGAAEAPTGVTGMAQSAQAELSWQPAAGATAYRVYRGTSATTVNTPVFMGDITPPDPSVPTTFADITPLNGTTYFYAVRSTENGVESANSRVVQVTPRAQSCSVGNAVVRENCYPGDADWEVGLGTQNVDVFATRSSIEKGQSVDLKVRSDVAVDIEVFRSGYYGGAGARLYSKILNVAVGTQPACSNDPSLGLVDCANWAVSETITTSTSWPSGVYLARVTRRDNGAATQTMFVVRDGARRAEVLYGIPDTTYQAYNFWGGKSLYDDKSTGAATAAGTPRAVKVSFDRPYIQPHDAIMRDWYTRADYGSVAWLERSGYDVSYDAVSELERNGARIQDHRVFISGAHDEYYSAAMRAALLGARDRGVGLFFTGANEVYWKVRFEPGVQSGVQDRTMVNYKSTQSGAADPSGIPTGTWRDPAGANAPENSLTGQMYIGQKNFDYFPLRVSAAEGKDRIWRYTGLENQPAGTFTNIGAAIVGWEWDARVTNGQEPPGVTTLASSPVDGDILQDAGRVYAAGNAISHMTKYTAASGALVVGTGTNHWNWGLALNADGEGEPDRRIQQATTNILIDMNAFPETPASDLVSVGERAHTLRVRDTVRPVVSRFRVSNPVFTPLAHPHRSADTRARVTAVKRGTRFRFRLSEAARVAITIQRRTAGKRRGGLCVKGTKRLRKRPNCTRFVKRGRVIRFAGRAGRNSSFFSGRFGRRALKPGRYRARLIATDAARNRSRPKTAAFRISRP